VNRPNAASVGRELTSYGHTDNAGLFRNKSLFATNFSREIENSLESNNRIDLDILRSHADQHLTHSMIVRFNFSDLFNIFILSQSFPTIRPASAPLHFGHFGDLSETVSFWFPYHNINSNGKTFVDVPQFGA
jgi:hypothetical protein